MGTPLRPEAPAGRLRAEALSPREAQVTLLVARGMKNNEIAKQLGITEATVKVHLRRVYRKLGCRNRTELAVRQMGDWREM